MSRKLKIERKLYTNILLSINKTNSFILLKLHITGNA
jgi:hypothetical protein